MSMRFWPGWIFSGPNLYFRTCAPGGGAGSRIFGLAVDAVRADVVVAKAVVAVIRTAATARARPNATRRRCISLLVVGRTPDASGVTRASYDSAPFAHSAGTVREP